MQMSETAGDTLRVEEHHSDPLPWAGKGKITVIGRSADGSELWREVLDAKNALTDQGANYIFGSALGPTAKSTTWAMGLATAAPSAGSTLGTISEATAGNQPGYTRKAITWDFSQSRHAKTGNLVWTATGAWVSGVTHLFICDATSGTSGVLLNYLALSATRQPAQSGDTVTVSWDGSL